jgi:hypothetical protein
LKVFLESLKIGVGDLSRNKIVNGLINVLILSGFSLLAQAEVTELDMSPGVDEHVIGFHIAVDIVFLVDSFNVKDLS